MSTPGITNESSRFRRNLREMSCLCDGEVKYHRLYYPELNNVQLTKTQKHPVQESDNGPSSHPDQGKRI